MMVDLVCMQCARELPRLNGSLLHAVEVQDSGLYRLTCERGHESVVFVQEQKFEVLYEIGVNAICDRYYREAVTSFTAALERFYEFAIRVICLDREILPSSIDQTWKAVAAQSERQFGAYAFLSLLHFGIPPQALTRSQNEFRNAVVHKGTIPSREDAIAYGQVVLNLIVPQLSALKEHASSAVNATVHQHLNALWNEPAARQQNATMTIITTISISRDNSEPQPTLSDALRRILERRELLRAMPRDVV
jgi:hypothetical protein